MQQPLAERMRPKNLEEYVGQEHLVGKGGMLRNALDAGVLPSLILWGPPGVGKTTLARILAETAGMPFIPLSAIDAGVKEVREVIRNAEKQTLFDRKRPVLFIDEIHRFSKAQQDALLGAVEKGIVTLIGATTENPGFEVIAALLSRMQVYVLKPLTKDDLILLTQRALEKDVLLSEKKIELEQPEALLAYSSGDARRLMNLVELLVGQLDPGSRITNESVERIIQHNQIRYDKGGDQHYDVISAFIKSVRGSDPNAAVYWLARMIEGGEDAKFIARRMIILASEDIGNANPNALLLANATFDAIERIGMPEGRIILSQCATYLASSPKSNASYLAIGEAQRIVSDTGPLEVPIHLRNAPNQLMKELGYSKGYQYAHDHPGNFVDQEFLPDEITGKRIYDPGKNERENALRRFLKERWKGKYGY
ncbi:MAG: replication-associated recombination protein A [Bacteroidota bacterium]|nr:replication-associated recombination protein A [Bacteroidota bacterium]MDX5427548.1 replication-associated recombination protein A [Bacteroidota bacterium]MDX5447459.1 replication-associated recombination protein A [Bacteroidota bacterium]MDX5505474.1 replication-associated recombination protein A [Bacteroidota bacterium]